MATDAAGCSGSGTSTVNVLPTVTASVTGNTNLCEGASTVLTAQPGGMIYSWFPGGQSTSSITVSPSSTTTYSVIVSNGSCSDTASITVNVTPASTVNVNAGPNQTINIGGQTTLTGSGTGNYNWNPTASIVSGATGPNPVVNPTVTTTYTLTIVDPASGCAWSDTVTVFVTYDCGDVFVPNAFSPNNDGKNDFVTVRSPCITAIDFTIYNRWGQAVFRSDDVSMVNNPLKGWDGYFKGKLCDPAVFYYFLNVSLIGDEFKTMQGNISLVR